MNLHDDVIYIDVVLLMFVTIRLTWDLLQFVWYTLAPVQVPIGVSHKGLVRICDVLIVSFQFRHLSVLHSE